MRWKKKELRCKIGMDLHESLQFKLLQLSAGHDVHHVQPGLSNRPVTSARAPSCTSVCYSWTEFSIQSFFRRKRPKLSPYFVSLSAWFGRVEFQCKRSLRVFPSVYQIIYTAYQTSLKRNYLLHDFQALYWNIIWDAEETVFLDIYHSWVDERSTEKTRTTKEHRICMERLLIANCIFHWVSATENSKPSPKREIMVFESQLFLLHLLCLWWPSLPQVQSSLWKRCAQWPVSEIVSGVSVLIRVSLL